MCSSDLLEKTKRSTEIVKKRIFDEINSLILEIRNLSQKTSDEAVQAHLRETILDLEQFLKTDRKSVV